MKKSRNLKQKRQNLMSKFLNEWYGVRLSKNGSSWASVKMGRGDWDSDYCADPFLFFNNGSLWLFYETLGMEKIGGIWPKGVIGCFKLEGTTWVQQGIVLDKPNCHLSYPQVFEEDGHVYMIPESYQAHEIALYEAEDFPRKWVHLKTLVVGDYVDSTLLKVENHYYLITVSQKPGTWGESPEIWHSDSLLGEWKPHPQGERVNRSRRLRRNGGYVLQDKGRLWRIAQDCNGGYGKRVFKVPILKISPTEYLEGDAQLVFPRGQWGMHHTYNRLAVGNDLYEVIDVHGFKFKGPLDLISTWFGVLFRWVKRHV